MGLFLLFVPGISAEVKGLLFMSLKENKSMCTLILVTVIYTKL